MLKLRLCVQAARCWKSASGFAWCMPKSECWKRSLQRTAHPAILASTCIRGASANEPPQRHLLSVTGPIVQYASLLRSLRPAIAMMVKQIWPHDALLAALGRSSYHIVGSCSGTTSATNRTRNESALSFTTIYSHSSSSKLLLLHSLQSLSYPRPRLGHDFDRAQSFARGR